MDVNGNGLLIEQENLHVSMGLKQENFSLEKFRYMCILSGCDYLASLPGIGLAKARRFITRTIDPDIYRVNKLRVVIFGSKNTHKSRSISAGNFQTRLAFKYAPNKGYRRIQARLHGRRFYVQASACI